MTKVIISKKIIQIILIGLLFLTGCSGKMTKLGINDDNLTECPSSPNCVNSQANDNDHHIPAILFNGTTMEANTQLLKTLNELKRTKIVVKQNNYIRVEFVSALFRFIDDVEFYFPKTDEKKTTIEVRSASRTGYSDFGANRKRIEQIRSLLQKKTINSI